MDLSIIVVSYNARADLERCLALLHEAPPAASHEIIVVDNGSIDGSVAAVRRWPDVRVIELGTNRGFAAATNVGIKAGTGEHVLLLNSDTLPRGPALDGLLAALRGHPEAAVAGPRLVDGAGRVELSFGRMISPLNEMRQKRLVRGHARGSARASRAVERMTRLSQWPDWVSGACLLVRRTDAEAVGLLDERFFLYTEDVDFCAAIRARGRRILFTPEVEVVHLGGRSAATAPAATRAAYHRSHLAFYIKHHPRLAALLRLYRRLRGEKLPRG
jgi:GT2 family glycosyltransferase